MKRIVIIMLCLGLFSGVVAFAETVHLKTGKTIEGEVLEKTEEYIRIDAYGVPITIFLDEIASSAESSIQPEPPAAAEAANKEESSGQPGVAEEKTAPAEENIYENKKHGFSMIGPKGWEMFHIGNVRKKEFFEPIEKSTEGSSETSVAAESIDKKYLVIFRKPGVYNNSQRVYVEVKVEGVSQVEDEAALLDYIGKEMDRLKAMLKGLEIIAGPQEVEINGNKVFEVHIKGGYKEEDLQGVFFEDLFYYFLKDGRIYNIIASSVPASDFAENQIYFRETIDSLKF